MGVLKLADIPAAPEGMNQQVKPWHIPDGQARYIQDAVLDKENEINRRGPVKPISTFPTTSEAAVGMVATDDPNYQWRLAILTGTASTSKIQVLNTSYTSLTSITFGATQNFDPTKRYRVAQSSHPRGGALIGVQNFAGQKGQTSLAHWYGGSKATYSTGTITVAQDATSVTGSGTTWTSNVEPGMFLYAICDVATGSGKNYIGTVKSVDSNTGITLMEGALFAVTGRAYNIKSIRALDRRVAKGTITTNTSSAVVNGANTKFKRQMTTAGDVWTLFRADDMKYIGKVTSVASDIQLTLTGNAAIACNKDEYVAINVKGDLTIETTDATDFGWITAQFAGRVWYAGRPYSNKAQPLSPSRVWFSDIFDPEAIDCTADGDHIFIPSTEPPVRPITAMIGLPQVLVVFKENETYGIYGTDESNFSIHKIDCPDGALSPMVVQRYQDGVVFAGSKGLWFFDGEQVFDLSEDRIGDWYEKAMEGARSRTYGCWSMIWKGNYILYTDIAAPPTGPDKTENSTNAQGGTPPVYMNLCVNLDRRAFTTLTNVAFVGAATSPDEENQGTVYVVNKMGDTTPFALVGARFCQAADLFDSDGLDTITTDTTKLGARDPSPLGPDFYFESKRYDLGTPGLKKRFKQLQMNYWLQTITGDFITNGNNTIAGTVGYTTVGGTSADMPADFKVASKFTAATAQSVTSMKVYVDGLGSGSGSQVMKAVIYTDNAGAPDALVATGSEVTVTDGQAAGWVTLPITYDLSATTYWLGIIVGSNTNSMRIYYNAVGSSTYDVVSDTYVGGASNPFGSGTVLGRTLSIYAVTVDSSGATDYANNALYFASLVGLNELSTTSASLWNPTRQFNRTANAFKSAYQMKRIKFNKRSQHFGFKMWQKNTTGIKKLRIGGFALATKDMRVGRV